MLYDVHAHLDLYENCDSVMRRLEQQGIYVISMTNLPDLYGKYIQKYTSFSRIRFALGLHPELAKDYSAQLARFLELLPKARYVGEIGLDYSTQKSMRDKEIQKHVFERIISACKAASDPKILSIHSRAAANEVIRTVGKYHGQVILHWLSDRGVRVHEAVDNGYYFSVNAQMASYKNGQNLIRTIPINRVLVESDAPFTKTNRSDYSVRQLASTTEKLATIYKKTPDQMCGILLTNFKELLSNSQQST